METNRRLILETIASICISEDVTDCLWNEITPQAGTSLIDALGATVEMSETQGNEFDELVANGTKETWTKFINQMC